MEVLRCEGLEGDVTDDEVEPVENEGREFEHCPAMAGNELCCRLAVYIADRQL